jgi:hypothetical protein
MRKNKTDAWLEEEEEVKDGQSVRVPMMIMDSTTPRRNLSFADAQAAKNAAYDEMCRRLTGAWRTPLRDQLPHDDPAASMRRHLGEPDDDPTEPDDLDGNDIAGVKQARARYLDQLQSAWKTPPRMVTGFGPNTAPGPNASIVGSGPARDALRTGDVKALRDAADAAWNEMRDKLSNAWRGGR